jgi:hypothetical protein
MLSHRPTLRERPIFGCSLHPELAAVSAYAFIGKDFCDSSSLGKTARGYFVASALPF